MEYIKKFVDNKLGYKIATSAPAMLLQVLVAALTFHFNKPAISLYIFIAYIMVLLVVSKDMTPIFLPLMLVIMTLLACYGSTPEDFVGVASLVIICIVLLIVRPFIFKTQWRLGKMFVPMMIVAVSLTIGGIGYLKPEQYFTPVNMYYVLGLGFGLVIVYLFMLAYTLKDETHNPTKVLTNSMLMIGLLGVLMVYPVAFKAFIAGTDWAIQWSNTLSTIFILTIPFAFYMASKTEKYGAFYFIFGCMQYLGTLFTLSRGGILFGTITAFMCIIATIVCASKLNRIIYATITASIILVVLIIFLTDKTLMAYLKEIMHVSADEARANMFKLAIDNFLQRPMFGTGLGFKGDFYYPQQWAMYWYHSTPFQIIGSLGIFGIIAYVIQFFARARICIARPSKFNVMATIALLGFELMACVNPGDFTPLPSMVAFTAIMVVLEISNRDRVESQNIMFNNYKGANWYELFINYNNFRALTPPDYSEDK